MPLSRPCIEPGCDEFTTSTRCASHARERWRARGSTTARGYGSDHQRARDELRRTLPAFCGYGCGAWLEPSDRWVAAHVVDGDPTAGYLVACPSCNERAKRRP